MTFKVEGISYNNAGAVLGSCECRLFKHNTGTNVLTQVGSPVTSHATTGAYAFTGLADNDPNYCVGFFKSGSPNLFDITDRNLVPVTESAVWTPATAGAKFWYKVDDAATVTKDGSNFVSQLNDKSGANIHLLQATASNKGLWTAGVLNSKPGILFDSASPGDFMASTATFSVSQPFLVMMVLSPHPSQDQVPSGAYGLLLGGYEIAMVFTAGRGALKLYAGSFGASSLFSPIAGDPSYCLYGGFNGASSKIKASGQSEQTVNPGTGGVATGIARISVGGNEFAGYFHEGFLIPGDWTTGNLTSALAYVNSEWGV